MARFALLSTAWLCASSALAEYAQFVFSTNATDWKCPKGLAFGCDPPRVCTYENLLDKWYCCDPSDPDDGICWSGSTGCSGSDKSTPGANQLGCGSFCCLKGREECTQRVNQINICWAVAPNPVANLTGAQLNDTFSSLSSASPTATTLSLNLQAVLSSSTPTPSASTSSPASNSATRSIVTQISTNSASPLPAQPADSSSLSGGAIGGIVVGAVGGLALIGGVAFFLWRRGKKNNAAGKQELESVPAGSNPYSHIGFAHEAPGQQEKYAHEVYTPNQSYAPPFGAAHEMDAGTGVVEVDGSKPVANDQTLHKYT